MKTRWLRLAFLCLTIFFSFSAVAPRQVRGSHEICDVHTEGNYNPRPGETFFITATTCGTVDDQSNKFMSTRHIVQTSSNSPNLTPVSSEWTVQGIIQKGFRTIYQDSFVAGARFLNDENPYGPFHGGKQPECARTDLTVTLHDSGTTPEQDITIPESSVVGAPGATCTQR